MVGGGKGIVRRQAGGLAVGVDEVDGALILIRAAAGEVVVGVERRDRYGAHRACGVGGREAVGDQQVLSRGSDNVDHDIAGDGAGDRIGRRDGLAAGRLQDHVGKGVRSRVADGEGIAGRETRCLAVGTEEVDRALIQVRAAAHGVAKLVPGGHRDCARRAGLVRIRKAGRDPKSSAAAGTTLTARLVPVIVLVTESVAVMVWLPAVSRTTLVKMCDPASPAVNE